MGEAASGGSAPGAAVADGEIEGWDFVAERGLRTGGRLPAVGSTGAAAVAGGGQGDTCAVAAEVAHASRLGGLDFARCGLRDRLEVAGFAVFDGATGPAWASAVRAEIVALHREGHLRPSFNKLAAARDRATGAVTAGHTLAKHGVSELDVCVDGEVREAWALERCPCLRRFWERDGPAMAATMSRACPSLRLAGVDTVKLQVNTGGGGCFPMHYDTSTARSSREITAILYLNPAWAEQDAGELRLYPFPLAPVDVAPVMDRLAVFNSTEMLHRVMPSNASRVCLSVWFAREADAAPLSLPCRLPPAAVAGEGTETLKFLLQPDNRKLLSKVTYSDEWAQSFTDAFGDSPELREALAVQRDDVTAAAKAVPPGLAALVAECLPIPVPDDLASFVRCGGDDGGVGGGVGDGGVGVGNGVADVSDAGASGATRAPASSAAPPSHNGVADNAKAAAGGGGGDADLPGTDAGVDVLGGTAGGIFSSRFLTLVRPLYDAHMGVEHMAPLLYALMRFVKPTVALEVGAGYTTPFMLQALADNHREVTRFSELHAAGAANVGGTPWCVPGAVCGDIPFPVLRCVDNLAHEHTTAHLVIEAAQQLGTLDHLDLYFKDAYDYLRGARAAAEAAAAEAAAKATSKTAAAEAASGQGGATGAGATGAAAVRAAAAAAAPPAEVPSTSPAAPVDFAFLDFGQGDKVGAFVEELWPLVRPGGLVLVHSTVTNALTRSWLERMRAAARDLTGLLAPMATLSLREPHKLFQNSFSVFQKRAGFDEPVLTKYP